LRPDVHPRSAVVAGILDAGDPLTLAGKTAYEMTSDRRDSLNRYFGFTI
jgi:hypothetical protein